MEVIFLVLLTALFSHSANAQIVSPSGVDMGSAKANFVCRSDASCSSMSVPLTVNSSVTFIGVNGNVGFSDGRTITLNRAGDNFISAPQSGGQLKMGVAGVSDALQLLNGNVSGSLKLESTGVNVPLGSFSVGGSTLVVANGTASLGTGSDADLGSGGLLVNNNILLRGTSATNTQRAVQFNSQNGTRYGSFGSRWVDGNCYAEINTGSTNRVCINSAGNTDLPTGSFSVGTSTLVVTGGKVGIGNTNPDSKLHISSGTIFVDGTYSTSLTPGVSMFNGPSGISRGQVHLTPSVDAAGGTIAFGGKIKTVSGNVIPLTMDNGYRYGGAFGWVGSGATPVGSKFYFMSAPNSNDQSVTELMSIQATGAVSYLAKTKAQILAIDPIATGEMFYCSDCTASNICISTGTAVGQFSDIQAKTVACQ